MRWMMAVTFPKTTACIRAGGDTVTLGDSGASMMSSLQRKLTADEHDADGEDLLRVRVRAHVPEAHAGEAAEGEVERGDVGARHRGTPHGAVDERGVQTLPQLLKPT